MTYRHEQIAPLHIPEREECAQQGVGVCVGILQDRCRNLPVKSSPDEHLPADSFPQIDECVRIQNRVPDLIRVFHHGKPAGRRIPLADALGRHPAPACNGMRKEEAPARGNLPQCLSKFPCHESAFGGYLHPGPEVFRDSCKGVPLRMTEKEDGLLRIRCFFQKTQDILAGFHT